MDAAAIEAGLSEARRRVEELAARIDAPVDLLPTYGRSEDSARPHIDFDGHLYHYMIVERGEELSRRSGRLDDVLEWAFVDITSAIARRIRPLNRNRNRYRGAMFVRQLELIGQLNQVWRERRAAEIDAIVARAPLVDER